MKLITGLKSDRSIAFKVDAGGIRFTVHASDNLRDEARISALKQFELLDAYGASHPDFKTSFVPVEVEDDAPQIIRAIAEAAEATLVGPTVAMPGAVVEEVARDLSQLTKQVIVSAEGDTFIVGNKSRSFVVRRPSNLGEDGVAVRVSSNDHRAFFTSTGRERVDPHIGNAAAIAVVAERGALACAAASAMGYAMKSREDVDRALEVARRTEGVAGALVLADERIGVWGDIEFVAVAE